MYEKKRLHQTTEEDTRMDSKGRSKREKPKLT